MYFCSIFHHSLKSCLLLPGLFLASHDLHSISRVDSDLTKILPGPPRALAGIMFFFRNSQTPIKSHQSSGVWPGDPGDSGPGDLSWLLVDRFRSHQLKTSNSGPCISLKYEDVFISVQHQVKKVQPNAYKCNPNLRRDHLFAYEEEGPLSAWKGYFFRSKGFY